MVFGLMNEHNLVTRKIQVLQNSSAESRQLCSTFIASANVSVETVTYIRCQIVNGT